MTLNSEAVFQAVLLFCALVVPFTVGMTFYVFKREKESNERLYETGKDGKHKAGFK